MSKGLEVGVDVAKVVELRDVLRSAPLDVIPDGELGVLVQSSQSLIDKARQLRGLPTLFGLVEDSDARFGVLYLYAAPELGVVVFDLSDVEVTSLLAQAATRRHIKVLLSGEDGDCMLLMPGDEQGLRTITTQAKTTTSRDIWLQARRMGTAMKLAISSDAFHAAGIRESALETVYVHGVVSMKTAHAIDSLLGGSGALH